MRVMIDCAALGSGIGGDETWLTGCIEGLAAVTAVDSDDRFPLLVESSKVVPVAARARSQFPTVGMSGNRGLRHFAVDLDRPAVRRERADLLLTITHSPIRAHVPSVLVVGDLSFLHMPKLYPRTVRHRLNWLVPRQARRACMVLTPSEFSRADLIDSYGLDPEKVRVVPNRVIGPVASTPPTADGSHDDEVRASWARANGIDRPFLLYLGNVHPRKNLGRLIEAFATAQRKGELNDALLVIAGARWWATQEGRDAISQALPGSIVELGRVDDATRTWLLEHAVALAYPSLFEGFGLPPLEAMAHGTPVLASNVTSLPEVLGDAAVLVNPYDTDAIADGLVRLWNDDDLRLTLQVAGRRQANEFSCERVGRAAVSALRDSVHQTGR